jgi:hypothetical protein
MSRLRTVLCASWRSCVRCTLDRTADLCLSTAIRLLTIRDRVCPQQAPEPPQADAIIAAVLSQLEPPAFTPSATERVAASICDRLQQTICITETPYGYIAAGASQPQRIA